MRIRRINDIPTIWHNIEPFIPALKMIGAKRDEQKRKYASTQNWAKGSTHSLGLVGELILTLETGISFDSVLRTSGDPGYDIDYANITYDAKTVTHPSPDIKEMPDRVKRSMRYILIATEEMKRAKVIGWATREQLEASPLTDYDHGPMRSIPWYELREFGQLGMPPELPNDTHKGAIEAQKLLLTLAI